jgi:hypothetical protein
MMANKEKNRFIQLIRSIFSRRNFVPFICFLIVIIRAVWNITFDYLSFWLLFIAILVILIPDIGSIIDRIRKVKIGDNEIEFDSRVAKLAIETEKVENEAQKLEKIRPSFSSDADKLSFISGITAKDPRSGLISLSLEIESAIRKLAERNLAIDPSRRITLSTLVDNLTIKGILPKDFPSLFRDFWSIRNEAIHNIAFQPTDKSLYAILDLGVRILQILKSYDVSPNLA